MENYYLGLDIGTDSVGYAVTNETYDLLKFRGEPMWGATTFEAAALAADRRMYRTARRRLDRKQQRVQLLNEIFAPEICKVDPNFFIRRKESALFSEDTRFGVRIFDGGLTDQEYHKKYPTIHHLILDLMAAETERDIRLVYLACAWLVANRGHFLFDADVASVSDFSKPYFCLDGFENRKKRLLAGRLADMTVYFSEKYDDSAVTDEDAQSVYEELEKMAEQDQEE